MMNRMPVQGPTGALQEASAEEPAFPEVGRRQKSFRGIWAQPKPGASFEGRRLMRMTHQPSNGPSRRL